MCQCMKTGWKGWRGCPLQWREGFTDSKRMSKLECSNISVSFWMRTCCPAVSSVFFNPHKRAQQKLKNSHRLFLSSVLMKRAQDQAPTGDRHPLVCKSPSKLMLSYSIGKGLLTQTWTKEADGAELKKCARCCWSGLKGKVWASLLSWDFCFTLTTGTRETGRLLIWDGKFSKAKRQSNHVHVYGGGHMDDRESKHVTSSLSGDPLETQG